MVFGDIAVETIAGGRTLGGWLLSLILEVLLHLPGYALLTILAPGTVPSKTDTGLVGLGMWAGMIVVCIVAYHLVSRYRRPSGPTP